MIIRFENVGRNHVTFLETMDGLDYDRMYRAVKSKAGIMSRDIEFYCDDDAQRSGTVVVGGLRIVGKWKVVSGEEVTA